MRNEVGQVQLVLCHSKTRVCREYHTKRMRLANVSQAPEQTRSTADKVVVMKGVDRRRKPDVGQNKLASITEMWLADYVST